MGKKRSKKKKRKSRKTIYLFNAYVISPHKLACGCPCVLVKETKHRIFGVDFFGCKRIFMKSKFTFEYFEKV